MITRAPNSTWFPWILDGLTDDPEYVIYAKGPHQKPRGRTEQVLLNMNSNVVTVMKDLMGFESTQNIDATWTREWAQRARQPSTNR